MPTDYPCFHTTRLTVLLPGTELADVMLDYYRRNRAHLEVWEPRRSADFWTTGWWQRQLDYNRREYREDRGARMAVMRREEPGRVVGIANLSNIIRGSFRACHLGYSIDHELEGGGFMFEALEAVVQFAFEELGLHRVMANYQPDNERSGRLLGRLGFEREGYARDYLFINGAWRDHVLTSIVRPEG